MWIFSNNDQLFSFGVSLIAGIIFCIGYDVLRGIRKAVPHTAVALFFEDVIFFALSGVCTFLLLLALSCGEMRGYILLGELLGALLFNFTLSRYFRSFITYLTRIYLKVRRLIADLFERIRCFLSKVFESIKQILLKISEKIKKCLKNILQRKGEIVYTEKNNSAE